MNIHIKRSTLLEYIKQFGDVRSNTYSEEYNHAIQFASSTIADIAMALEPLHVIHCSECKNCKNNTCKDMGSPCYGRSVYADFGCYRAEPKGEYSNDEQD